MSSVKGTDFASLLDELLAESAERHQATVQASTLDFLAVAEELHSGRIVVTPDDASRAYAEGAERVEIDDAPAIEPVLVFPSTNAEDIAGELALAKCRDVAGLDRVRRRFALANHPDRVAADMRGHAEIRMQIANELIDQAKKKLTAS